MIWNVHIT